MIHSSNENSDSQQLVNQIILEFMREKRRKRRTRWIVRLLILLVIIFGYIQYKNSKSEFIKMKSNPHAGLIDLNGNIFDSYAANADYFSKGLNAAYKNKGLQALIIRINSPGGSPVQAEYMFNSLQYYRKAHPEIKIYAVCVDICASAAYYVAAAADEIYASESSMVGSIGVLYNGFGFVDSLQKLGVTRRLQIAGKNKGFLDPFSPVEPQQQVLLQTMLNDVHSQFINRVKLGRGSRLKVDDQTFSGLIWTGTQAKERGLIDGFASSGQLARETLKMEKLIDYTYKETVYERVSKSIGTAMATQLASVLGLQVGFR